MREEDDDDRKKPERRWFAAFLFVGFHSYLNIVLSPCHCHCHGQYLGPQQHSSDNNAVRIPCSSWHRPCVARTSSWFLRCAHLRKFHGPPYARCSSEHEQETWHGHPASVKADVNNPVANEFSLPRSRAPLPRSFRLAPPHPPTSAIAPPIASRKKKNPPRQPHPPTSMHARKHSTRIKTTHRRKRRSEQMTA
jgi:hypothetical protein